MNANRDSISSELAEVIRCLVRAVVAEEPSSSLSKAAKRMAAVEKLLQQCQESPTWLSLFATAVDDIRDGIPIDADERQYIRAAGIGAKYLIESSARDGFAAARTSQAFGEFRQAIKWSEEARSGQMEF